MYLIYLEMIDEMQNLPEKKLSNSSIFRMEFLNINYSTIQLHKDIIVSTLFCLTL